MSADGILMVGIGGAAVRFAADAAKRYGIERVLGFDSDISSALPGVDFRQIGAARLEGRGTGGDPIKARAAAQDDATTIREACAGARLAVVAASLGGGFGSGASPEILKAMRDAGAATLCIATTPFGFEGAERASVARRHLSLLEGSASAVAAIALDDLFAGAAGLPMGDAYAAASERMSTILTLIWRLASSPGYISMGPEHVAALMAESTGRLRVAIGSASGDNRATAAAEAIFASPLPGADVRLADAGAAMLGVIAGQDLRLAELSKISGVFSSKIPAGCKLDIGVILDDSLSGSIELACLFSGRATTDAVPQPTTPEAKTSSPQTHHSSARKGQKRDPLADTSGTRFRGIEGTIYAGQNLDLPTYLRRNLVLDR